MARIKIWVEDDATIHDPDHETLRKAYKRLYGETLNYTKAVLAVDCGDGDEYTFMNGAIVWASFPGGSAIFEEK